MILVFGKNGQVGDALSKMDGTLCLDRAQADLSDPEACANIIRTTDATAIINAAAYTNVNQAETDRAAAQVINADAPAAMARAAAARGLPFVHISTDYVFEGSGQTPWMPDDTTAPSNAYGASKHDGEIAIRDAGGTSVILRTSWVFSAHGKNFVKTMLQFGAQNSEMRVVDEEVGGPTPAKAIAEACLLIAHALQTEPDKAGIYHFSGAPDTSWAGFAKEIFAQANMDTTVIPIRADQYETPANRPKNSRMNCDTTEQAFGIKRPKWSHALTDVLSQLNRA